MDSWVCIHQDFENKKGQTVRISLMYDYFADVCINCYCILITASYAWYVIYITYLISSLYNILSISVTCKDGSRCVIKWSILYNLKELGCGMLWNLEKKDKHRLQQTLKEKSYGWRSINHMQWSNSYKKKEKKYS